MFSQKNLRRVVSGLCLLGIFSLGFYANAEEVKPNNEADYHPLMWELKGSKNSVYLFGSVHIARPDFYPLPQRIERAYQHSDILAVEVDPSAGDAATKMRPFVTYAAPDNLEKHLTAATWQRVVAKMGSSISAVQTMKPAMLSVVMSIGLYGNLGYAPDAGIDLHFIANAKASGKKLLELETMELQAAVLGGLDDGDGEAMLKDMLDGMDNGEAISYAGRLVAAWKSGNADGLVEMFDEEARQDPGSARAMKALVDDRNPEMAKKIAQLFKDGKNAFVVVGVGHLVGGNSIVQMLKKQGMDVRQIQ